ncbi:hypothetical protein AgCh_011601 [Apium graveolens]
MLTSVGGGVSACRGLHSSFRPTQGGLSLNIDVSTTMILIPGPVIDFLRANQGIQDARRIDWIKTKKMLRNVRVKATHSNREFKIKGLSEKPCNELYFTLKEKPGDTSSRGEVKPKEITVYEYFRRHLNLELRTCAYFSCIDVDRILMLDTILGKRLKSAPLDCLLVRQSFFHDDSRMLTSVGGGVSACLGLHSSFRPTQGGLSLSLDVSTTMILTPGPVIDFLRANQGIQDARRIDWITAKKMLRNMRVKATHSNPEFKIKGLSEKPCNELYFRLKEKPGDTGSRGEVKPKEITVYEYFRRHLNLELRISAYFSCIDVDVSTTMILTSGPVIDFLRANQCIEDARRIDWIKAKKMLRNMRVKATHSNREFKIKGLSEKPCNELYFTLKEKPGDTGSRGEVKPKEVTVYEYFRRHLNLELRISADCLLVRQSFFHDDSRMLTSVGGGVSACRGLHSSFRPSQGGLSLNLDVSMTMILTPGPVIDFLRANQGIQDARRIDWIKAKKMLRNMRVKATHSNREFKIKGLSEKPCNELYFTLKEKSGDTGSRGEVKPKEITVYEYFRRHLNLELRTSAYFPCIDVGKPSKPIYLPLAPGLPSAIYKITIFCANSLCVIGGNFNNGISGGSIGDISNLHVFNLACRYLSEFSSSFPDFSISHYGVLE